MTEERTLVFLKPDAVLRRYTGARLLNQLTEDVTVLHYEVLSPGYDFLAGEHYVEHEGRFFFEWLTAYVSATPVHVLILEGDGVIDDVRDALGDTVPNEADPESLRGRYGIYGGLNTTHASDSPDNAEREIARWEPLLDDSLTDHEERLAQYVDRYIDYPQIDPVRYREVTTQYIDGDIDEATARSVFTALLARESDAAIDDIVELADVMIENADLER